MRRSLPSILAITTALAILIALGVWQLERLAWKTELLKQIDAAEARPAVPLAPGLPIYAKVRITGRWRAETALYGAEGRSVNGNPLMGAHLLGVLQPADGPPVVVDRGWVAPGAALPAPGQADVEGWMHPPAVPGWFTPADDMKSLRFYTLDPARIGPALGAANPAPFVLVALGPASIPDPARLLPRPPNDHLSYALTWFGLAAALIGVVMAFALKSRRAR